MAGRIASLQAIFNFFLFFVHAMLRSLHRSLPCVDQSCHGRTGRRFSQFLLVMRPSSGFVSKIVSQYDLLTKL